MVNYVRSFFYFGQVIFALTADIIKIYQQIRFNSNIIATYLLARIKMSPSRLSNCSLLPMRLHQHHLAIRALRTLAEDNANRYPRVGQIALRDFYMDDLVTGADS